MARGKVRDKSKEVFWRRTMRRQGQSGLTVRAFCRKHAVRETAFYFWRSELARRKVPDAAFMPVRVVEEAPALAGGRIEIVLPGDRRVHVAPPVDRRALADVLAVLRFDALAAPSNAEGALDLEAAAC